MEYEEMRRMEKTHVCAQCDCNLVTIWNRSLKHYSLVCAQNRTHHGYKPIPSLSQALARGQGDKLLGEGAQKDLEKMAAEGAPALSKLPEKDIATGNLIPRDKILALIDWGTKLTLKPNLGHVCLYYGKPYVTIDGYYYLNNKREKPYVISTRPMSEIERRTYQVGEDDHTWIAEGKDKEGNVYGIGLGIVTREEIEGRSGRKPEEFRAPVVHDHPQRMAEKRAEWQLLRKLIPLEEAE